MKESGIRILEIGYEAPILWIVEHPDLPDNKGLAEKRLQSLVIRFAPEPDYEKKYRTAMEENFTEGYAVRHSTEEADILAPAYYLPHFGVYKNSPEKKIRIV